MDIYIVPYRDGRDVYYFRFLSMETADERFRARMGIPLPLSQPRGISYVCLQYSRLLYLAHQNALLEV